MSAFSPSELARYNRHLLIPGFGIEAQEKLKKAKVLVVGTGGLGSPLLLYLAAAGIGTLGIIDHDVVDESNLQRQIIFDSDDVGLTKVDAAKSRINKLNEFVKVIAYDFKVTAGNALELFSQYDIIADGSDNFPTRYLVNDAAVICGKPLVYASVSRFDGQVAVFNALNEHGEPSPNYRDLYPKPPSPGLVPSCEVGGVLGVLPGIIGSMQALEVIKLITGLGDPLVGKYFVFDALNAESQIFHLKKNPEVPPITGLINYEEFCGLTNDVKEISVKEFEQLRFSGSDFQLIDVREKYEFDIVNIGGELIPSSDINQNINRIHRDKMVIIHCKSGGRSSKVIRELQQQYGLNNLYNLKGGILSYITEIDPTLNLY